ncbi:hypothetical protein SAMN05216214_102250 [Atopomonas hussainii]|uniref:Uncharacterized protein n=1 Tax=Atopomonas hussainii TaxID=1429083 RepID=A0A1H7H4U1_9GAMM|nr:hypothetical protein [Atopomonas hussainii]SEK43990.1 hypothetical protein SAMN05216214_102250 [Atopomonas hussainii]
MQDHFGSTARLAFRQPARWPWQLLAALGHLCIALCALLLLLELAWQLSPEQLPSSLAPAGALAALSLSPLLLGYWLRRIAKRRLEQLPTLTLARHLR